MEAVWTLILILDWRTKIALFTYTDTTEQAPSMIGNEDLRLVSKAYQRMAK